MPMLYTGSDQSEKLRCIRNLCMLMVLSPWRFH